MGSIPISSTKAKKTPDYVGLFSFSGIVYGKLSFKIENAMFPNLKHTYH